MRRATPLLALGAVLLTACSAGPSVGRQPGPAAPTPTALVPPSAATAAPEGPAPGLVGEPSDAAETVEALARGAVALPVPTDAPVLVGRELFGMHLLHSTTSWPTVPISGLRLWDTQTTWNRLQPQRGVWDFQRLDAEVALARQHGAEVLMTLGQTPQWASAQPGLHSAYGPGAAAPPASMEDWRTYVTTLATRYHGRIGAYELWNEVNFTSYWAGSMGQLADLNREAYTIIKRLDPQAKVVSPSFVPANGRTSGFIRDYFGRASGRMADAVSLHVYGVDPEQSSALTAGVRKVLASAGVGRLPIWNTEVTYGRRPNGDRYTASRQAGVLARTLLLAPSAGQRRVYWYAWDDWDFGAVQMKARSGQLTSTVGPYREVTSWLNGAYARGCRQRGSTWSCAFNLGNGARGLAVWSVGGRQTATAPAGYRFFRTLQGGHGRVASSRAVTLTEMPILLTTR